MTVYYNGIIVFENELSDVEQKKLAELFPASAGDRLHPNIFIEGDKVSLKDYNGGSDVVEDMISSIKSLGNTAIDGSVTYYGDYEGRYEVSRNKVTQMSADECAIADASDAALMAELAKRGYIVSQPENETEPVEDTKDDDNVCFVVSMKVDGRIDLEVYAPKNASMQELAHLAELAYMDADLDHMETIGTEPVNVTDPDGDLRDFGFAE